MQSDKKIALVPLHSLCPNEPSVKLDHLALHAEIILICVNEWLMGVNRHRPCVKKSCEHVSGCKLAGLLAACRVTLVLFWLFAIKFWEGGRGPMNATLSFYEYMFSGGDKSNLFELFVLKGVEVHWNIFLAPQRAT